MKSKFILIMLLVAGSFNLYSQQCAKNTDPSKSKFEIKEVEAIKAITIKTSATMAEIGPKMGELYQKLFEFSGMKGLNPSGPPFCVYLTFDPEGSTEFECGIPVDTDTEGTDEIKVKDFPKMKVLSTLYVGPYENMMGIYEEMQTYLQENKLKPTGLSWEIYLTDPGQEPDSTKYKTIIYFPVE